MTGAVAGAALMSGCSTTNSVVATTTPGAGESDVLNFALNLEYLEASFYSYITQGSGLSAALTGGGGPVTGAPSKLTFTISTTNPANPGSVQQLTDLLNEIYFDEINHVSALRSLLGVAAVPMPAINLAAFGSITATNALSIARLFEDVGVTAYAAATSLLASSNITFAGQILGVESFHAGALRLLSIQNPTVAAYTQADGMDVAPFDPGAPAIAAAGPGANGGFFATAGALTATAAVPAGVAFIRTTSQVLSILYGSLASGAAAVTLATSGTTLGGFFPSGVNGNIKSV
jgi:hypothetical protein